MARIQILVLLSLGAFTGSLELLSVTSTLQGSLMEAMYSLADLLSLISSSSHFQSYSTGQGSEGGGDWPWKVDLFGMILAK